MRLRTLCLALAAVLAVPRLVAAQAAPASAPADSAIEVDGGQMPPDFRMANVGQVVKLISQNYPRTLRDRGITGEVTLAVVVDPAGRVETASVARSSGQAEFDNVAIRLSRSMRFTPPRLNGVPVRVRMQLPVSFLLQP